MYRCICARASQQLYRDAFGGDRAQPARLHFSSYEHAQRGEGRGERGEGERGGGELAADLAQMLVEGRIRPVQRLRHVCAVSGPSSTASAVVSRRFTNAVIDSSAPLHAAVQRTASVRQYSTQRLPVACLPRSACVRLQARGE